jgi:hypothetical protein
MNVELIHGTRLIPMTFETNDPEPAARIANAAIDAYNVQDLLDIGYSAGV